jgi:hypothetical protein
VREWNTNSHSIPSVVLANIIVVAMRTKIVAVKELATGEVKLVVMATVMTIICWRDINTQTFRVSLNVFIERYLVISNNLVGEKLRENVLSKTPLILTITSYLRMRLIFSDEALQILFVGLFFTAGGITTMSGLSPQSMNRVSISMLFTIRCIKLQ